MSEKEDLLRKELFRLFALEKVTEESSELTKATLKAGTYGDTAVDPKTHIPYDNIQDMRDEFSDLMAAMIVVLKPHFSKRYGLDVELSDLISRPRVRQKVKVITAQVEARVAKLMGEESNVPT